VGAGHGLLHHALPQRPTFRPAKQWFSLGNRPGAPRSIIGHRRPHDRQDRHHALLRAFAGHDQRFAQRQIAAGKRKRLRDTQPRAIHQQQHRAVARADPVVRRQSFDHVRDIGRVIRRHRARQALLDAWSAQSWRRTIREPRLLPRIGQKRLQRRQFARGGNIPDTVRSPRRQLGAQIGGAEPGEGHPAFALNMVQPARGRGDIRTHRMR